MGWGDWIEIHSEDGWQGMKEAWSKLPAEEVAKYEAKYDGRHFHYRIDGGKDFRHGSVRGPIGWTDFLKALVGIEQVERRFKEQDEEYKELYLEACDVDYCNPFNSNHEDCDVDCEEGCNINPPPPPCECGCECCCKEDV